MARKAPGIPETVAFVVNGGRSGIYTFGPYSRRGDATRVANLYGGEVVEFALVPVEKMDRLMAALEDGASRGFPAARELLKILESENQ